MTAHAHTWIPADGVTARYLLVMAEGFGLDDSAAHHDRMADKRDDQRDARKVRMAAKRRRGWS